MKICTVHWQELRTAIDIRGLSSLIKSQGNAIERIKDEMAGLETNETYDPLLAANNMITCKALELGGLYLMTTKEDGTDYCPLCEAEAHSEKGAATNWINGCTNAIKLYCKENKLID